MIKIITKSREETKNWAKKYAKTLQKGTVIALIGDLGAGKTTFSQGLAEGLKIKQNVNSPTYVIMKIYSVNNKSQIKNLVHIDAYRLQSEKDLEAIGVLEYFNRKDTIILIEWADKVKKIIKPELKPTFIQFQIHRKAREITIKN